MNADHIGQLAQLTRGERANAEVVIESLIGVIDTLVADRKTTCALIHNLQAQVYATEHNLLTFADRVRNAVTQGVGVYGGGTYMNWGDFQVTLADVVFGEVPWATSPIPSVLDDEYTEIFEEFISQLESQSGVIQTLARAKLEEKLTKVKKSLLNKPWLKTQDRTQTGAKPPQVAKPTSTVPVVVGPNNPHTGPENG